jgi:DDE superfamily endonuclease
VTQPTLQDREAPDPNERSEPDHDKEPDNDKPCQILLTAEPSCKDEARIGQKNGQVRQWARTGSRPRQPADQRYESAYLFGAICPERGVGAALALPEANTQAMQLHLEEIAAHIVKGAHGVLLMDRAGWHTTKKLIVPDNITLLFLPSRSPELNPVENIWQYLRQNWLSNRVFESYEAIIEAACDAWRRLIALPATITSIGLRNWAHNGQSL